MFMEIMVGGSYGIIKKPRENFWKHGGRTNVKLIGTGSI